MSEQGSAGKGAGGSKVKLSVGKLLNVAGGGADVGRLLPPSIVTPVLRDVGKLAASVAAVNTNGKLGSGAGGGGASGGSATGNPRNKCILEPGHSLMDWIRLGNSGKDLTGVGALAGKITVSPEEMRKHNSREDAWIAIRGNVYNVTEYLAFHPGGVDEIMRGVGLPDATSLFDEVHPWVNYDKMLTKCFVGRLGIAVDTTDLFVSTKQPKKNDSSSPMTTPAPAPVPAPEIPLPVIPHRDDRQVRFDWIQKHDILTLYFYTGANSNPCFEIGRPLENKWSFVITFIESVFTFNFSPLELLLPSPRTKIFYETGKIEASFEKDVKRTWSTCGTMEQSKSTDMSDASRKEYIIREHMVLNEYTFMISVEKRNASLCHTPLGYHIMLYNDKNNAREYTPVPHIFIRQDQDEEASSPLLTFLVRRYADGQLSNFLYNKRVGDVVYGSDPIGSFDLQLISEKRHFVFLAGGVGITPFLGIIQCLLEKKLKPVQTVMLVNFNQTHEHQFLHDKFDAMSADPRFTFVPILTRPPNGYKGLSGYVTDELLKGLMNEGFQGVPLTDVFFFVCGPTSFNCACFVNLKQMRVEACDTFFFASTASAERSDT